jgi:uncharacterized protein YfcZ (UPF0381/DUF406 family)
MDSSAPGQVAEKSLSETTISEIRDSADKESTKPAQIADSKIGIDAERIRSAISRLTCNSTDELEKLVAKLQELQQFLKSETSRVQGEIESVLDGVGIIIDAIAPWKTDASTIARPNGRDKLKRWP